jgi:hypothetical protein
VPLIVVLSPFENGGGQVSQQDYDHEDVQQLLDFRQRYSEHPFIVVVGGDLESAVQLALRGTAEIVRTYEMERELEPAIRRLWGATFFISLTDRIRAANHIELSLRTALVHAVNRRRPACSLSGLTAATGISNAALGRMWRSATGVNNFRLEDFLDWLILMRAAQRRGYEGAWQWTASAVRVNPRTLRRLCMRLTELTLREMGSLGFASGRLSPAMRKHRWNLRKQRVPC